MNFIKYIYWRDDIPPKDNKRFANVHILVGYTLGSLQDYMEIAEELRKTFLEASFEDIFCGEVFESDSFKHYTLIRYDGYIDGNKAYTGWTEIRGIPSYKF